MHLSMFELKMKRSDLAEKLVEETLELSKEESISLLDKKFQEYRTLGILTDLEILEPVIDKLSKLEGSEYLKELSNYFDSINSRNQVT